jgi:hypothetical protein
MVLRHCGDGRALRRGAAALARPAGARRRPPGRRGDRAALLVAPPSPTTYCPTSGRSSSCARTKWKRLLAGTYIFEATTLSADDARTEVLHLAERIARRVLATLPPRPGRRRPP